MKPSGDFPPFDDSAFDLRARAELALAFEVSDAPAHLFKHAPALVSRRGFQRSLAAFLLLGSGSGAVMAVRPPPLVRGAIEHEYYERTLRGNFMDGRQLMTQLGLGGQQTIPGFPQLMRPCDIDGHTALHLTTFFEKGGMVTVFAFDQNVALPESSGWWGNVYWQVVMSSARKPLVLVAQKKKALAVAIAALNPASG